MACLQAQLITGTMLGCVSLEPPPIEPLGPWLEPKLEPELEPPLELVWEPPLEPHLEPLLEPPLGLGLEPPWAVKFQLPLWPPYWDKVHGLVAFRFSFRSTKEV